MADGVDRPDTDIRVNDADSPVSLAVDALRAGVDPATILTFLRRTEYVCVGRYAT